jgi:hypothetical protein
MTRRPPPPPGAKSLATRLPAGFAAPKPGRKARPLPRAAILAEPAGPSPGRWEVTIPDWHPTRLNVLMHARWASSLKRKDAVRIGTELRLAGVPAATTPRRLKLVIVLGPRQRAGDPDAYDKSTRDGLVRAGALVDDNRQWLAPLANEYERSAVRATRIILEDVM